MLNRIKVSFIVAFLFPLMLSAQHEVVTDLVFNKTLQIFWTTHQRTEAANLKFTAVDTLALPFIDDFSFPGVFPSASNWIDSSAFVNNAMAKLPPTNGVATFDGANKFGNPYDKVNPNAYGIADYMTSKPVNLNLPGDTSVYLSFYYQPQGFANAPEPADSLVLEFYGLDTLWHRVWASKGEAVHPFKQVLLNVNGSNFLHAGFQFRFKNYATYSGNVDHWHIDYVYLNRLRTYTDTIYEDVTFIEGAKSPLRTFESMPWNHYLNNIPSNLKDTMQVLVQNISGVTKNVNFQARAFDMVGASTFSSNLGNQNLNPGSIFNQVVNLPSSIFPTSGNDSATFQLEFISTTTPDINRRNDTLRRVQNFYNYYAYDDGTAENGYGLNVINGKIAYKYELTIPDTLRGVMMHFTQIGANVSNKLFRLAIWTSLNPEVMVFSQPNLTPKYTDSLNGYYVYSVDPPIAVSGSIYVGWVQDGTDLLNIGLDRNINSNDKMFYNATGTWYNSLIAGSWMIRPLFGKPLPVISSIQNPDDEKSVFVFPNPTSGTLQMNYSSDMKLNKISITDLSGRVVFQSDEPLSEIDLSRISIGVYFLRLSFADSTNVIRKISIVR